jgi:hypothetical protein
VPLLALSLQQLADLAQVVAACATVLALLGLLFVWKQVKLQQDNSRVELVTGMTTLIVEVDRVFIEFPETRQYFRNSTTPPPESQTLGKQVRAVGMTMANVLDHVVEHLDKMKPRTQDAWRYYVREVYLESPVLQELLSSNPRWWPGLQEQIADLS